jgi:tetratricopeptide (TPR) repeat protein
MGTAYRLMENYSMALSCYKKTLDIWQKSLRSDHPFFLVVYQRIGVVYAMLGRQEETMDCFMRGITLNYQLFGPDRFQDKHQS